jgi:hypothetical protein
MEAAMEMAETITPDAERDQKRRVGRSPAYPFLSVQKAIEKARDLYAREGAYAAPLESALKAWGYGPKSSGGRQTLATMKYYGLIDISGEGDKRRIKVSDVARRIILDQREDESEKRQLIRKVAMNPAAHRTLFEEYPTELPSDGSIHHFLIFEHGFNEDAARELLVEYKETASYIGLYEPQKDVDKLSNREEGGRTPPDVKVGDLIQATVNGQHVFPQGARVLGVQDGWVFTDQSDAGVKLEEVTLLEAAQTPPAGVERPPIPPSLLRSEEKEPAGMRKAVFPVRDGDVSLVFPKDITARGLRELGMYLQIFLKNEEEAAGEDK